MAEIEEALPHDGMELNTTTLSEPSTQLSKQSSGPSEISGELTAASPIAKTGGIASSDTEGPDHAPQAQGPTLKQIKDQELTEAFEQYRYNQTLTTAENERNALYLKHLYNEMKSYAWSLSDHNWVLRQCLLLIVCGDDVSDNDSRRAEAEQAFANLRQQDLVRIGEETAEQVHAMRRALGETGIAEALGL
jgi:hypothetical protein